MSIALSINVNLPIYNKTPTYKPLPQLNRRQRSFFESAKAVSLLSDHPQFHLGCVIVEGSRIISSGCNSITRCSPIQKNSTTTDLEESTEERVTQRHPPCFRSFVREPIWLPVPRICIAPIKMAHLPSLALVAAV